MKLSPGVVIAGRYRLDRPLGEGGMGMVWAATHLVTRRPIALKLLRASLPARPDLAKRLLREARAATLVRHPNVIDVLDVFELDDCTPVLVMDLLEGETLGSLLAREGQLDLERTASILIPVVSAVGTAHARGIVHRDLKPDNIFLAEGHQVKVLDFGVAKLADAHGLDLVLPTQTGATLGTPCYMAPEQAVAEKDVDHRSDVWALGVILYECLSGARPIEGESVGQVVMHLMSLGVTPLERVAFGLPEEITTLVGRMLSRDRAKRPELGQVLEALGRYTDVRAVAFGEPCSEAPENVDDSVHASAPLHAAPSSRRVRRALAAGVAALFVAIGALYLASAKAPGEPQAAAVPAASPPPVGVPAPTRRTDAPAVTVAPVASRAPVRLRKPVPPRVSSSAPPAASASTPTPAFKGGLAESVPF